MLCFEPVKGRQGEECLPVREADGPFDLQAYKTVAQQFND